MKVHEFIMAWVLLDTRDNTTSILTKPLVKSVYPPPRTHIAAKIYILVSFPHMVGILNTYRIITSYITTIIKATPSQLIAVPIHLLILSMMRMIKLIGLMYQTFSI